FCLFSPESRRGGAVGCCAVVGSLSRKQERKRLPHKFGDFVFLVGGVMSISVSRHASPRVLKIAFGLLIGTLGQSLFAQQVPAAPSSAKAAPALTISGKVASSNVTQSRADAAA